MQENQGKNAMHKSLSKPRKTQQQKQHTKNKSGLSTAKSLRTAEVIQETHSAGA